MAMTERNHQELARVLDAARLEAREIPPLTQTHGELPMRDAYSVQAEGIRLRTARGERVVGMKMGFTSEAKRQQMNLNSPIYGVLTNWMYIPPGARFRMRGSIHPKIEPEIAFFTKYELRGRITREQALDACPIAMAAMEILDSRYVGFKYFSLPDVVADNCSSSMFVLSTNARPSRELDLLRLQMTMEVNGEQVASALSNAISGDPLVSVVQLCELLAERGESIPAGSIVLSGAATAAHMMKPGDQVQLMVEGLGSLAVSVTP